MVFPVSTGSTSHRVSRSRTSACTCRGRSSHTASCTSPSRELATLIGSRQGAGDGLEGAGHVRRVRRCVHCQHRLPRDLGARTRAVLSPRTLAITLAGSAFGDGLYFAEDVGKADQYATADKAYDCECNIHQRLYSNNGGAGERMHPGDVYYVLVCRVPFGVPFVTVDSLSFYPSGHLARNPYGELLKEGDPGEDACAQVTDRLLRLNAALADSSWPERVTLLNPTSAKKNQEGIPNNVPGVDPPVEFPSVLASNTPPSAGRSIQRSSPSPNPDLDPNPNLDPNLDPNPNPSPGTGRLLCSNQSATPSSTSSPTRGTTRGRLTST